MVPFESFGAVSYSHSIATMAASLAVPTQYTKVTDTNQPDRQTVTARRHRPRICIASRGKNEGQMRTAASATLAIVSLRNAWFSR